jgi:hypothetical protein
MGTGLQPGKSTGVPEIRPVPSAATTATVGVIVAPLVAENRE